MARYIDSACRLCRREGLKLFLKGDRCYSEKCAFERRGYAPGDHGQMRRKQPSDYGIQLREKQKLKRMYGLLEKQFHGSFETAERKKGITGTNLLLVLERRLDNMVHRQGRDASRRHRAITLFYEQSTRTRASFEVAAKALGADVVNLTASGSSVEKGESLVDTIRTLEAIGADVIVMRHGSSGAPYLAARHTRASIVNGGDGTHAHPTQALLDLFTMRRHLGDLAGKRVVIVGDVLHSRVARSNLWTLLASGRRGRRSAARRRSCRATWPAGNGMRPVTVTTDFDDAIDGADVVMTLRIQKERQESGLIPSLREYIRGYQLNAAPARARRRRGRWSCTRAR